MLDIIEDIDELETNQLNNISEIDIKGTRLGYDDTTQINTFITGGLVTFLRQVEGNVRLDLDNTKSYNILLIQNGKAVNIIFNGGNDSTITIKQSK